MFATPKPNPAIQDYRDVLSAAEYPRTDARRAMIGVDWNEDRDWLEKK